jgi:hypothetical protein
MMKESTEPQLWEVHAMTMGSTCHWLSYMLEKSNEIFAAIMYILFPREVQVSGPKSLETTKRSVHPIRIKILEKETIGKYTTHYQHGKVHITIAGSTHNDFK